MTTGKADIWAAWIRHRRTGGDPELEAKTTEQLAKTRDRVLDNARLQPGETLPTFAEAMEQVFTAEERDAYVAVLRPLVEGGRGSRRVATSFLWAVKR